jgi:hypothetical protein
VGHIQYGTHCSTIYRFKHEMSKLMAQISKPVLEKRALNFVVPWL